MEQWSAPGWLRYRLPVADRLCGRRALLCHREYRYQESGPSPVLQSVSQPSKSSNNDDAGTDALDCSELGRSGDRSQGSGHSGCCSRAGGQKRCHLM